MKWNNDNNENNGPTRIPVTVLAKLLHFKDKEGILYEAKSRQIRNFYFKEDFSWETLTIRKGIWNEIVMLQEEEGRFAVINYDGIYSPSSQPRK